MYGWTTVTRKRKYSPGAPDKGGVEGERCFRCLGWGHRASACRDPPKCWSCGRFGHRSLACVERSRGRLRSPPEREEGCAAPGRDGSLLVPVSDVTEVVVILWSRELDAREEGFRRSIALEWRGTGRREAVWEEVERALGRRWKGLPPLHWWILSPSRALVRCPSISLRDVMLGERSLACHGGEVKIMPCDCGVGGNTEGHRVEVVLRGVPLLWRTPAVLRCLVRNLGHLLDIREDAGGFLPDLQIGVWRAVDSIVPQKIPATLDGWFVEIKVEVLGLGVAWSFAEVVRGNRAVRAPDSRGETGK
ncbi:hypothetical protein QJS10_CPB12g00616 [Acorus calamus]|uniref:CCHC-type domain-containing protein n=1 Tax=Acorus calamus TaxID=4465 RepID=A0AAV9DR83_ACOCL|nr:hypothetical protein QJS10_CPB12g00616 [Acorus calamus]